jgi:hypothetical protein
MPTQTTTTSTKRPHVYHRARKDRLSFYDRVAALLNQNSVEDEDEDDAEVEETTPSSEGSSPTASSEGLHPEEEYGAGDQYFKCANAVFTLDLPSVFTSLLIDFQRYANNRKFLRFPGRAGQVHLPRYVWGVSNVQFAADIKHDTRVVSNGIKCLDTVGLLSVARPAGFRRDGQRHTAVYHVPKLTEDLIQNAHERIAKLRKTQPALFLLRPDRKRERERERKRQKRRPHVTVTEGSRHDRRAALAV